MHLKEREFQNKFSYAHKWESVAQILPHLKVILQSDSEILRRVLDPTIEQALRVVALYTPKEACPRFVIETKKHDQLPQSPHREDASSSSEDRKSPRVHSQDLRYLQLIFKSNFPTFLSGHLQMQRGHPPEALLSENRSPPRSGEALPHRGRGLGSEQKRVR